MYLLNLAAKVQYFHDYLIIFEKKCVFLYFVKKIKEVRGKG